MLISVAPSRGFLTGWIVTSIVAETAAVMFGVLSIAVNLPGALGVAALEGVLLAVGQCVLLRRRTGAWFTTLWAPATVAGALLGRTLEYYADVRLGPHTLGWSMLAQIAGGIALGFAVGVLMGLPQTLALLPRNRRAWLWMAARGVAWAIALPLLLLTSDLTPAVTSVNAFGIVLFGIVGVPALIVGAIEGRTMTALLADQT